MNMDATKPAKVGPVEQRVRPLSARLDVLRVLLAERHPEHYATVAEAQAEIQRLRTALEKIADWDSSWGPFPENNEAWRAMVVVTAREAVPPAA